MVWSKWDWGGRGLMSRAIRRFFLYVMSRKMRMTPGEAGYFKARALGTSPRRLTTFQ